MKRWLSLLVGFGCLALIAMSFRGSSSQKEKLQPLVTVTPAGQKPAKLPADAIVLSLADGADVTPPFIVREDASAAGGVALVLPTGSKTKDRTGKARLSVTIPSAGTWQAWARVRWRDSCSNSLTLKVGEGPEQLVGEDSLYSCWHWVEAGKHKLAAGKVPLTIIEREDGIALDQLLFTCDAKYLPVGAISPAGEARGIRRFADDFSRSPGHGMDGWDLVSGKWDINFSFDPNRIPNQYALVCNPGTNAGVATAKSDPAGEALALVKGAPWYGCRLSFSFLPDKDGRYGAVLDRSLDGKDALQIAIKMEGAKSTLEATGPSVHESVDASSAIRMNQWHHVVVERWAWITHVFVDGNLLLRNYSAAPRAGRVGFFVASGSPVFDDIEVEEIPWQADDGGELHIAWSIGEGGEWFRTIEPENGAAKTKGANLLIGKKGTLSARLGDMPLEEIFIEQLSDGKGKVEVEAEGLKPLPDAKAALVLRRPDFDPPVAKKDAAAATLKLSGEEARISRVALRYGERVQKKYIIGPYHFTEAMIPDPSDYLDFTPEELKKMAASPDAEKFTRQQKFRPLVGDFGDDLSPWIRERGNWRVREGMLSAMGPSILRHMEEITRDVELRLRLRMEDPRASAEIELYAAPDHGIRVHIDGAKALSSPPQGAAKPSAPAVATLQMPDDKNWHDLIVRVKENSLTAGLDKDAQKDIPIVRGDGGRLLLKVFYGRIDFDDIEISVNKSDAEGGVYPFAQRETDWWRESSAGGGAQWVDHGGISCVLASSWISMMAPQGDGLLWNKRKFGPDAMIAFDVEENTQWYGWDKPHTHDHHPFDNISLLLAPEASTTPLKVGDKGAGYRLEVNAENRSATVLYRNGKEVARAAQDHNFPMRYVGGHAPFFPRINRIVLLKRGTLVRGLVDGREFIRFEDPEPIAVQRIGLGGYNTHINFSHLEVHTLTPQVPKESIEKKTLSSTVK